MINHKSKTYTIINKLTINDIGYIYLNNSDKLRMQLVSLYLCLVWIRWEETFKKRPETICLLSRAQTEVHLLSYPERER